MNGSNWQKINLSCDFYYTFDGNKRLNLLLLIFASRFIRVTYSLLLKFIHLSIYFLIFSFWMRPLFMWNTLSTKLMTGTGSKSTWIKWSKALIKEKKREVSLLCTSTELIWPTEVKVNPLLHRNPCSLGKHNWSFDWGFLADGCLMMKRHLRWARQSGSIYLFIVLTGKVSQ